MLRAGIGAVVLASLASTAMAEGPSPEEAARRDAHSFGNPGQVRVEDVALDLTVDFARKRLRGTATLRVERSPDAPAGAPLVLDTRALTIEEVAAGKDEATLTPVPFRLGKGDPILGAPLMIRLPERATIVRVAYQTAPTASALQWVDPPQTAGGTHPFLFTQSEAIHARSWIPLQDSPGVRVTYTATVHAPEGLRAVMAADAKGADGTTFRFAMPQPIPPYLIALAVGDLAFREIGPRTGVYAEPSVLEKAADEFADTERMVATAEKRYGPYRWGRYDLLVLPPSFPFGGMENPKLTFATPTVIAGDRSLVSLVAHELAHSWSGNLVSNATWSDFWLNEGFTTYIERRIVEDLYGPDRAAMERVLGVQELRKQLDALDPRDQVLQINLKGRDPGDAMTRVPYDKGALFLLALERAFGRERFDAFLKGYFDHFAFRSITTADFEAYLRDHLFRESPRAARRVNLRAWIYAPGLPEDAPSPRSDRLAAVDKQRQGWVAGTVATKDLATADWTTQEWLRFLRGLPERLQAERMADLDAAFQLTDRKNAEIACQWLEMSIRAHYAPGEAKLDDFLTTIGRRRFLLPLYGELNKTQAGKARARAIFARARRFYHPIAVSSVERLLEAP